MGAEHKDAVEFWLLLQEERDQTSSHQLTPHQSRHSPLLTVCSLGQAPRTTPSSPTHDESLPPRLRALSRPGHDQLHPQLQ